MSLSRLQCFFILCVPFEVNCNHGNRQIKIAAVLIDAVETPALVTSDILVSIPGHAQYLCDREGDSLQQRRYSPVAPVSSYIAQHCL